MTIQFHKKRRWEGEGGGMERSKEEEDGGGGKKRREGGGHDPIESLESEVIHQRSRLDGRCESPLQRPIPESGIVA